MVYQFPRVFGATAVLLLLTGCGSAGVLQEMTATPAGVGATAVALIASTPTQPATTIPTATASSAPVSTTVPEPPSATPEPPRAPAPVSTTVPEPPSATPEPPRAPAPVSTMAPEPPSATPEPTAALILPQTSSFPNGQTEPYSTGLDAFQTTASDPSVGENNGDGIESVNFEIVLNGAGAVYSKREERAPFCAFGDQDISNCNSYDFAANANKWPDGTPIANGQYTLVVVTRATSGASKREELPFAIQLAPDAPTPTPVLPQASIVPQNATFTTEMFLQSIANDPSVGSNDGDGIESVRFQIIDPSGQQVHKRTERGAAYCAFGGGDNGAACTPYVFAEHNNAWLDGTPIQSGGYTVHVTVRAKSGATFEDEMTFTITLP